MHWEHCGIVVCAPVSSAGPWFESARGAYAPRGPRQGVLSTIVSLDPGVVNGYLVGIYSSVIMLEHLFGSSATARVIITRIETI